jgi:hypothetical protein
MSILILDGVTGAGKTSIIGEIIGRLSGNLEIVYEDDTLGDLMDQIRDPSWLAAPRFDHLEATLSRVEASLVADPDRQILVERFHLTAFALFPHWGCYERFDTRLRELGAVMALLTFPTALAEIRSIARDDRKGWDTGMDEWYGSRAEAVKAVVLSQRRRCNALTKTRLPFLHIDTRDQDWDRCARTILAYWLGDQRTKPR